MDKLKSTFKYILELASDWKNLLSWFLANIIVSSPWIFFLILAILTGDPKHYTTSAAIYAFQMLPIPIESVFVIAITIFIRRLIGAKNPPSK
jgi:hypothetical protein